jgi:hypothetical protein
MSTNSSFDVCAVRGVVGAVQKKSYYKQTYTNSAKLN